MGGAVLGACQTYSIETAAGKEVKMGAMTMTPSLGLVLVLDRPISKQMKYPH
jgi:mannitol-specific phosphotransferase system IIBC component